MYTKIKDHCKWSCKTRENSNFWKKGKIVISVKTRNFSRSRMTKRISPFSQNLANTSNSYTVEICTFFEESSIGCSKTTCDVTKVTSNMYSCDTCCMSREMRGTDGLDGAKWQKSRRRDMDVILECLMIIRTK